MREVLGEIGAAAVPELLVFNKADLAPLRPSSSSTTIPARWPSAPSPARASTTSCARSPTGCARSRHVVELAVPYDRGDVLAAIHREGEVVSTTRRARAPAWCGPGCRTPRPAAWPSSSSPDVVMAGRLTAGFVPPPYPYDRLDRLLAVAGQFDGGAVDLSIGTPMDPPPPASSPRSRRPAPSGAIRRASARPSCAMPRAGGSSGASTSPSHAVGDRGVRRQQGVRRHAAAVAAAAHARARHGAVPGDVVPDLRDGRHPRRLPRPSPCRSIRRASTSTPSPRPTPTGRWRCGSTARATRRARSTTSPRPPSGGGRTACRCSPTSATSSSPGTGRAAPSSSTASTAWSPCTRCPSARTSPARRVGFYAGDAELVRYLQEVRKHVGMMVPGPAQAAGVVALDDDEHVAVQRQRYRRRLERMAEILGAWTRQIDRAAGRRLLPVVPGRRRLGVRRAAGRRRRRGRQPRRVLRPGSTDHVRVAVVQPDERIELVAERLGV